MFSSLREQTADDCRSMNANNEKTSSDHDGSRDIFTIGHSSLPIDRFVALLRSHDIDLLVDIRRHPGSRHAPQFGGEPLRESLEAAGIAYLALPALGGRRPARADSRNQAWRNSSFRGYADYMETADFANGLDELTVLAREHRVAIMCAEAVWWRCHRALVSDALVAEGWQVRHIMSDGSIQPHRLSAPARIVDGTLTYHEDASGTEQSLG